MYATRLKCTACGAEYPTSDKTLVCAKCGSVLDIEYDFDKVRRNLSKDTLSQRTRSSWRYKELLPISNDDCIVSLGEGMTPLERTPNYGEAISIAHLSIKLDYLNPTGSFKDRGTTVSVSKLKEFGTRSAMDDSSGNAGCSLAAYCAKADIECTLYVPASIPVEKLLQARTYGASIEQITGSRTDVAKAIERRWREEAGPYYVSHNLSPFFFEGMKTVAYEIAEQSYWQTPDHVVFPVGGGALLAAWKGFNELAQLGWIDKVPTFHCVQSEACMPIVQAFRKGKAQVESVPEGETIAGGIRITNPGRGSQVLNALRTTKGSVTSVTDEEILRHQRILAQNEGIFAEPTSCAALAGLEKLRMTGVIDDKESVVVPLTGSGLKDLKSAARSLETQT